jgi:ATP-binding cassette subfamily F protein 3
MRQALAMALQEYAGAVIMVSHDRHLLASITDRFLLVAGGVVQDFDGDLDDYARWLSKSGAAAAPVAAPPPVERKAAEPQRRRDSSEQRKAVAAVRTRLARVEKRMQDLSTEAAELDRQLADPAIYEPGARVRQQELAARRARVAQETEQVEGEWLELTEELERASA